MNISEPFIRRPIATSLLMLGILVFGIGAYGLLPVAALPKVDFPTMTVSVNYPGASPDTMASAVATPLEQQFAAIPSLSQMTSTSGIGSLSITLQFDLERNIDAAASDVQQAINAATGLLPADLPSPPTYRKTNPADRPVLIYAVFSDALPIYRVDDYAYTILAQKLSTVPGVSEARIFGQQPYSAHIQIDPGSLASRGIGLEDVRTALTNSTLDRPKGTLEGSQQTYTLDTNDQLFNAASFNNVIVAYRNGAPVRIKDVGQAIDTKQNARTGAWFFDHPAEGLAIQRQAGANTNQLVDTIQAMIPRILRSFPPSIHVELVSDRSLVVRAAVHDVELTMMLTVILVVIVIFIFLRTLWATVIPSISVPLSLLATFGVMFAVGYSLDNISLMALTISVGFVVDDAIVMIENIVRYIEQGDRPFDAAIKGAGQIGFTIISITFSLIAVFIPLLFMGGIIGRLFREFAVTVTFAVIASAFISLTLTPVMCALFLKSEHERPPGRANRFAERGFQAFLRLYDRGLVFRLPAPAAGAAFDPRADRRDGLPLRHDPQGLLSRTGHRLHLRPSRRAPGHLVRGNVEDHPAVRRHRPQGPRRLGRVLVHRRQRLQPNGKHRARVHPAEAARRARPQLEPDHPAPAAQGGRGRGREVLHAVRPGHQHRRPAQPHALPVHADRHRQRRAQHLGAEDRSGDENVARARGCRFGPAGRGAAFGDRHRSRRGFAGRHLALAD